MKNLTISIFGSKVFLEILKEINLFPDTKIIFFDDYKDSTSNAVLNEQIVIFFWGGDFLEGVAIGLALSMRSNVCP